MERRRPVFFSLVAEHIHSAAAAAYCTLFKYSLVSLKDTHTHSEEDVTVEDLGRVGFSSVCSPTVTVML